MIATSRWVSATMATAVVSGMLAFYNANAIAQNNPSTGDGGASGVPAGHPHHGFRDGAGLGRMGAGLQLSDAQRQSIAQIVRDSRATTRQRIYAVLTPEQQAKLPADFLTK